MSTHHQPEDLVSTQAETDPGSPAEAPPPPDPELVREVSDLARRVGGVERLRQLVDLLAGLRE